MPSPGGFSIDLRALDGASDRRGIAFGGALLRGRGGPVRLVAEACRLLLQTLLGFGADLGFGLGAHPLDLGADPLPRLGAQVRDLLSQPLRRRLARPGFDLVALPGQLLRPLLRSLRPLVRLPQAVVELVDPSGGR